ncbi:MAG TPA: ThuA domain-containing protein [Vicinamibacteria bacterium]
MSRTRLQIRPLAALGRVLVALAALVLPPTALAGERLQLLLVDGQSNHAWQETAAAITATLRNTGRFDVARTTSPPPGSPPAAWASWRPAFADYDVVVSTYKGEMWPAEVRADFEAYVAGGGGAVIFHAPLATFFFPHLFAGEEDWDAYSQMLSLGWRPATLGQRIIVDDNTGNPILIPSPFGGSSNHGLQHEFVVKSRRPEHPILNGVPTPWRHGKDELYHAMRGPAQDITVLASGFSDVATGGTGVHEPMLWTVPYGSGRVVTTVLGHRWFGEGYGEPGTPAENGPDALHCVGFQTLLARSAEWAATGSVTIPIPPAFPSEAGASIVDPLRGVWLKLGMKVNGEHPANDVVVGPGPVQLTLDMRPGGFDAPLDLYFGFVYQNQLRWFTGGGLSTVPAPLTQLTPSLLQDVSLLELDLPAGSVISFVMLFAEGSTLLNYDLISAVVVGP